MTIPDNIYTFTPATQTEALELRIAKLRDALNVGTGWCGNKEQLQRFLLAVHAKDAEDAERWSDLP
jgi:hypothetical protein